MTIDDLRELLAYDPETGELRWKKPRRNGSKPGDVAGCLDGQGYVVVTVCRRMYQAHRLAWALHYGEWPTTGLDHENLCKADNRIDNLRLADGSQNIANIAPTSLNTSGRKGVCWNRRCGKWQAGIKVRGRQIHLGLFDDLDAAGDAYARAAQHHFGNFARTTA